MAEDNYILENILAFSAQAHGEQTRKYTGEPYINHPINVALRVKAYVGRDIVMESAALLHDVLEDTDVSSEELLSELHNIEGVTAKNARSIHKLVVELTDVYTQKHYPKKNREERKTLEAERLGETSSQAKIIKYFDLVDNAESIEKYDPNFYKVFKAEAKRVIENLKIDSRLNETHYFLLELFKDED